MGYAYSGTIQAVKETIITFATDGLILQRMGSDPELKAVRCVITDEAHERTVATDILMTQLEQFSPSGRTYESLLCQLQ